MNQIGCGSTDETRYKLGSGMGDRLNFPVGYGYCYSRVKSNLDWPKPDPTRPVCQVYLEGGGGRGGKVNFVLQLGVCPLQRKQKLYFRNTGQASSECGQADELGSAVEDQTKN